MTGSGAGLTLTDSEHVAANHWITLDGRPVSELHATLASEAFVDAVVRAARDALAEKTPAEARRFLENRLTALSGHYADAVMAAARGEWAGVRGLARLTPALGSGQTPADLRSDIDDLTTSFTPLFAASDVTPTVVVRLTPAFREQRASQREEICAYLASLATGCDVRVVGTGLLLRWLVRRHREDLPKSGVPERYDPRRNSDTPIDEAIAAAADALPEAGAAAAVLRALAAEPTETLSYDALTSRTTYERDTIRGAAADVEEYDLAVRVGSQKNKRVELRPAGRQFLAQLETGEIDGQRRLSSLDENSVLELDSRCAITCTPREDGEGDPTPTTTATADRTADGPHRTLWLPRHEHAAAAAVAVDGGITAVDRPIEPWEDAREPRLSYDVAESEVVVSVELHTPVQTAACTAMALTDPRLRAKVTPTGLGENGGLKALRSRRQLGWLPDESDTAAEWWNLPDDDEDDPLGEARQELMDLTREYRRSRSDGDDGLADPAVAGDLLRHAHGLIGTISHALDRIGINVIREFRTPAYRKANDDRRGDLVATLERMLTVGSRYGDHSLHRQVFETREAKRETAADVRIDHADPWGSLLGSVVLVGPRAEDLADRLEARLATADLAEDAPEVAARVPVDTDPGRLAVREAVERVCSAKRLTATRAAVSLFDAVVQDPYTAAAALDELERGDARRAIRLDEVRYCLAHVPADRLLPSVDALPDDAPAVRAIVAALLRAERALTPAEVADMADVSERSVQRHTDALTALDIVRETDDGRLRVALPHRDADERGETVLPAAAREDSVTTGVTALDDLALAVGATTPVGDPATRLSAYQEDDALAPWVPVALALGAATVEADPPDRDPPAVTVGPTPGQTSLTDAEVVV